MKRAPVYIGFLFGLVVLTAALIPFAEANEPEAHINVRCNETHCILPKAALVEMIEAHNAHVEKIRALEKNCGFQTERNS
jgi:hypothetical protein